MVSTPSPCRVRTSWGGEAAQGAKRLSLGSSRGSGAWGSGGGKELTALPDGMKHTDALMGIRVRKSFVGQWFSGTVVDVDAEIATGCRAYHVLYEDGDQEHMNEGDLRKWMVTGRQTLPAFASAASTMMAPPPSHLGRLPRSASMGAAPPKGGLAPLDAAGVRPALCPATRQQQAYVASGRSTHPAPALLLALMACIVFLFVGSIGWSCLFGDSADTTSEYLNEEETSFDHDLDIGSLSRWDTAHSIDVGLSTGALSTMPARPETVETISPFARSRTWLPFVDFVAPLAGESPEAGHVPPHNEPHAKLEAAEQRIAMDAPLPPPSEAPESSDPPSVETPAVKLEYSDAARDYIEMPTVIMPSAEVSPTASSDNVLTLSPSAEKISATPQSTDSAIDAVEIPTSAGTKPPGDQLTPLDETAQPELSGETLSPPTSSKKPGASLDYGVSLWFYNGFIVLGLALTAVALCNSESATPQAVSQGNDVLTAAAPATPMVHRPSVQGVRPVTRCSPTPRRDASPLRQSPLLPPADSPVVAAGSPGFMGTVLSASPAALSSPGSVWTGGLATPLPPREMRAVIATQATPALAWCSPAVTPALARCSPMPRRDASPVKCSPVPELSPFVDRNLAEELEVTLRLQEGSCYVAETSLVGQQVVKLICQVDSRSIMVSTFEMTITGHGKITFKKSNATNMQILASALKVGPFNIVGGRTPKHIQDLFAGSCSRAEPSGSAHSVTKSSSTPMSAGAGILRSKLMQSDDRFRYTRALRKFTEEYGFEDNPGLRLALESNQGDIGATLRGIFPS